jgi:exonuclease VII small subunit
MKNEIIPADIKSKSLKESQEEINRILGKLENQQTNLEDSFSDYKRLTLLNKHIQNLFKERFKEISKKT